MNDTLLPALLKASSQASSVLWQASWQSALAVLLVWGICRLVPKLPAAFRCWLWRLALVKFMLALIVPFYGLRLPLLPAPTVPLVRRTPAALPVVASAETALPQTVPAEQAPTRKEARVSVPVSESPASVAAVPVPRSTPMPVIPTQPSLPPWTGSLGALWLLGIVVGVARLVQLAYRSRRWVCTCCTPVTDAAQLAALADLADRMGVRCPLLLTAPDIDLPLVVGFRRPVVVVPTPERLADFSDDTYPLMLAHELAHLRRRDLGWNWLATVVQIGFFFHPLVYLARREEAIAREMACDALALETTGAPAAQYGTLLFQIAARGKSHTPVTVLSLSGTVGAIKQRLAALQNRSPLSPEQLRTAIGLILVTALCALIPWRVVAQQPRAHVSSPAPTAQTESHTVSGHVVGADGQPVANASVRRYQWRSQRTPEITTVQTQPDGTFQLPWAGDLQNSTLVVTAPGLGLALVAPPKSWETPVVVSLRPAIALDATIVDTTGKPLPDFPIQLLWMDRTVGVSLSAIDPARYPARTDANGRVRVSGLSAGGEVTVAATDNRFASSLFAPTTRITGDTPEQQATISLPPAARATGRITFGPTGKPAADYRVVAQYLPTNAADRAGFMDQAISDTQGNFRFDRLPPGTYRFWVLIDGFKSRSLWMASVREAIAVSAGQPRTGINFVLQPTVLVQGRVTDSVTGSPLSGIRVTRGDHEDESTRFLYTSETTSDGSYSIRVPLGKAIVRLGDSPRATARLVAPAGGNGYQQSLITKAGQEYTANFSVRARFVPTGVAPVTGRVLGPNGQPVAGAEVLLLWGERNQPEGTPEEDQRTARTDAQGRFRAESLPLKWAGTVCEARVRKGALVARTVSFRVDRSSTPPLTLSLVLGLATSLSGQLSDGSGKPQVRVAVRLYARHGEKHFVAERTTDARGRYSFGALWPDMGYNLESQPKGYVGRRLDFDDAKSLKPGEKRTNANLVLEAAGKALFGVVVTPAGRPVPQVSLSLIARPGDFHGADSDAQGRFRFPQVGDGPMRLIVQPRWGDGAPSADAFRLTVRASDSPLRVIVK